MLVVDVSGRSPVTRHESSLLSIGRSVVPKYGSGNPWPKTRHRLGRHTQSLHHFPGHPSVDRPCTVCPSLDLDPRDRLLLPVRRRTCGGCDPLSDKESVQVTRTLSRLSLPERTTRV